MEDIPKGIIIVLLIITVLISVLGTWTVLDQLSEVRVQQVVKPSGSPTGTAEVSITVLDPNAPKAPPKTSSATGEVAITVLEPPRGGN